MAAIASDIKSIQIGEHFVLELIVRRQFSYVDYNNGTHPITAIRLLAIAGTSSDVSLQVSLTVGGIPFAEPAAFEFTLVDQATPAVSGRDLKLDASKFLGISEPVRGDIEFTAYLEGQQVGKASLSVDFTPMQEWLHDASSSQSWQQTLVSLASYSTPNRQAVLDLKQQVHSKLGESGKSSVSAMQAFLANEPIDLENAKSDVRREVKALYEVIQAWGFSYSNPPAEYTEDSQRIRLAEEIVRDKAATCLDSTLLFTSALEAMGFSPIIALSPGHAFAGLWIDSTGRHIARSWDPISPVTELQAYLDEGLLLVETTSMFGGQTSFEQAVSIATATAREALAYASQGVDSTKKYTFIDVRAVKASGSAKPIPELVTIDGVTTVVETDVVLAAGDRIAPNDSPAARTQSDNAPARVKAWKESLLDLTFFNPLLEMQLKSGDLKKGGFRILTPTGGAGQIEDYLQTRDSSGKPTALGLAPADAELAGGILSLAVGMPIGEENQKAIDFNYSQKKVLLGLIRQTGRSDASAKLKALARNARTAIAETGVNNLYITFGSLTWKRPVAKGQPGPETATSPLLLLPVTMEATRNGFTIRLDDADTMATNETLAIKLLDQYEIDIPKLRTPDLDDSGFDVQGLIENVRAKIIEKGYTDWRVNDDCTIGFFDFSTYHQWKDLNDNWQTLKESPLVNHLIETPNSQFVDPAHEVQAKDYDLDEEASKVPVETDGSQIEAIVKSLRGESFVIQGPPGTGKSQTITNLLARNMQEGKRVLFVCAKEAALEVVKNRLDAIGLGDFVLDLHGSKTKPATMRARLVRALDITTAPDTAGRDNAKYDYDTALSRLRLYPALLHTVDDDYGVSLYQARDKYLVGSASARMNLNRSLLATMKKGEKLAYSTELMHIGMIGLNSGNAKANEWSLSNLLPEEISRELKDAVKALANSLKTNLDTALASAEGREILSTIRTYSDLSAVSKLGSAATAPAHMVSLAMAPELPLKLDAATSAVATFSAEVNNAMANPGIMNAPLAQLDAMALEIVNANIFNRNRRVEALAFTLRRYIGESFVVTKDNYQSALETVNRLQTLGNKTQAIVRDVAALGLAVDWNPFDANDIAAFEKRAGDVLAIRTFIQGLSDDVRAPIQRLLEAGKSDVLESASKLAESFETFCATLKANESSIATWCGKNTLLDAIADNAPKWVAGSADGDLRKLTLWAELTKILTPLTSAGQLEAVSQVTSGEIPFDEVARSFDRAYWQLVFEKLMDDRNLGNFEAGTLDSSVDVFAKAGHKLREAIRDVMADEILDNRTFDGKAGVGRAGELRSTLERTRGQMSVRALLKKYWSTITEITPVIAASPDSVAKFMDVSLAKFDVVVFDEASQITVASSIGALGRAKSAIVVGDSKQMPPTALFKAGQGSEEDAAEDTEDTFARDAESILSQAVNSQIPSTMLTWHYRSQDELLIAFSNKEYYDGKLSSFPSPTAKREGFGIELVPVKNGRFFRSNARAAARELALELSAEEKKIVDKLAAADLTQTNPIEAMEIVKEVEARFAAAGDSLPSIGIVTMNEQQKKLIAALLEESSNPKVVEALKPNSGDYLFVRALEKVQGDERDVILMSIGFSRDSTGKVPLNFGPLSRAGGERRWNVAITRARAQVKVFCSFSASDLSGLTEASATGMHNLRAYLQLAGGEKEKIGLGAGAATRRFGIDRHRDEIRTALESAGWHVESNVGLSDFRIDLAVSNAKNPGEKLLGILLDGEAWNQRKTAADRDVLPSVILEQNMNWPRVQRVWLPAWMRDPAGEVEKLNHLLKDIEADRSSLKSMPAFARPKSVVATPLDEEPLEDGTDETFTSTLEGVDETVEQPTDEPKGKQVGVNIDGIPEFREFLPTQLGAAADLGSMHEAAVRQAITGLADAITQYEGPVSAARFASLTAKSFGLSSVKSEKAAAINSIPPTAKFARDAEGFIYPSGVKPNDFQDWKRQEIGTGRDIGDISLIEIANAMHDLCQLTHGLNNDDLFRQTNLAFGRSRIGSTVSARLEQALALALKLGILAKDDDQFVSA